MTRRTKNVAGSVHQRLLNLAKETGRPFNDLLQHYALERWLYRLSESEHADRFVLKGALMLTVWGVPIARPTRDIDLLARATNDLEKIREMVRVICRVPVSDDGFFFDHDTVVTARVVEDADYAGVRATFRGRLGNARAAMQIDFGFSDVVTPSPVKISYPTLLDMPAPNLRAYNRKTAIAEKLQAMVKIGELNSRMKDLFDIWTLSASGPFDGEALADAIRATFAHRDTPLNTTEVCFRTAFAESADKATQWTAFIRRLGIKNAPATFPELWNRVMAFLRPVADSVEAGTSFTMTWPPGGPWQPPV